MGVRSFRIPIIRPSVEVESFRATALKTGRALRMGQINFPSSKIDFLTPIWQRALGRQQIGPEDNFFELGGNPASAARIFQEIAQSGGVALPPFVIYQAPTISSLALLLSREKPLEFPPVVPLKAGSSDLPVFITHGMGGHLLEFFDLIRETDTVRPIFGLQTRGMDGSSEPFERIEDMAAYFLEAVRKAQTHGPYTLIGYSLGGLVALEMARRLQKSGETIALLAMIDSYPPRAALSPGQRLRLVSRLSVTRFSRSKTSHTGPVGNKIELGQPLDLAKSLPAMRRVLASSNLALNRYRPARYSGRVHFVRAAIPTAFPADPLPVWKPYLPDFVVETVPGDHHGVLTNHHRELASALTRYLQETENS